MNIKNRTNIACKFIVKIIIGRGCQQAPPVAVVIPFYSDLQMEFLPGVNCPFLYLFVCLKILRMNNIFPAIKQTFFNA